MPDKIQSLVIFQEVPDNIFVFVVDDDLTRFQGQYINSTENNQLEKEMVDYFYYDGNFKFRHIEINPGTLVIGTFNVVICGLLL